MGHAMTHLHLIFLAKSISSDPHNKASRNQQVPMNLESISMRTTAKQIPPTWLGIWIATAYVGAVLMPYRVLPYPEFLMNSWTILLTSIGLLLWFSKRRTGKITNSGITWTLLIALIIGQSIFIKPVYTDTLIFPIGALTVATLINLAISNCTHTERDSMLIALCSALAAASFGTFIIQTVQLLTPAEFTPGWIIPIQGESQPNGNVAQRNQAAFIHALGLVGVLWLSRKSRGLISTSIVTILILIAGIGIAMTGSRIGMLLGFLATGACTWQISQGSSQKKKYIATTLNSLLYIIGYLAFLYWYENQPIKHQFLTASDRWQTVSNLSRYALQEQAWQMFSSSPLIGTGWGSFIAEGLKNAENSVLPLFADDSHFFLSQIAAELGILGLLAITPAAYVACKAILSRGIKKEGIHWIILTIFVVYSCTEYPLWNVNYLIIFSAFISLQEKSTEEQPKDATPSIKTEAPAITFSLLLILGAAYWGKSYLDLHMLGNTFIRENTTPQKKIIENVAMHGYIFGLSPISDYYNYVLLDYTEDNIEDKIELGTRVLSRFVAPNILEKHGLLLTIAEKEKTALTMFKALCLYYPKECTPAIKRLAYIATQKGGAFPQTHALLIDWIKSPDSEFNKQK